MDLEAMTTSSVAPSDQAADLMPKSSLDLRSEESGESSQKHSTELGNSSNGYAIDRSLSPWRHYTTDPLMGNPLMYSTIDPSMENPLVCYVVDPYSTIDPSMEDQSSYYLPTYSYPVYYYEGGYEDNDNEWNGHSSFFTTEDLSVTPLSNIQEVYENVPLIYHPAYGYAPYHLDGTTYQPYLYLPTHVQQPTAEQLHPTTTTTLAVVSAPEAGDIITSTGVSAACEEISSISADNASAPVTGDSNGAVVVNSTSQISGGCIGHYDSNITDVSFHLTVGPRAKNSFSENQNRSLTTSIVEYNKPDFCVNYDDAKFFIIKSYSEDDVHGSIKYNVWSSTEYGNRKLDAAYQDAQTNPFGCPVFLFFSVNGSGQFVGVAEMVGQVDFNKNVDFWQQNKWKGFFPVKWHIVKDVPNCSFKHIIIKSLGNKPVTCSRDTQEVMWEEGLQLLKIFKEHKSNRCILDDYDLYNYRQMLIKERRSRQEQLRKQEQTCGKISKGKGILMC